MSGVGSITVVLLIYLDMSYIFVFQNSKVQTGLQRKVFPVSLSLSSFPWGKQVFSISGLSFQRYFMQHNEIYINALFIFFYLDGSIIYIRFCV